MGLVFYDRVTNTHKHTHTHTHTHIYIYIYQNANNLEKVYIQLFPLAKCE